MARLRGPESQVLMMVKYGILANTFFGNGLVAGNN